MKPRVGAVFDTRVTDSLKERERECVCVLVFACVRKTEYAFSAIRIQCHSSHTHRGLVLVVCNDIQ